MTHMKKYQHGRQGEIRKQIRYYLHQGGYFYIYKSLFTIQYGRNDNGKNKQTNIHSKLLHTMTVI